MLSDKKILFCNCYLITLNATEAVRMAGYKSKRADGLKQKGYDLLQEKEVKEYINEKIKEKEVGLIIKQDEILSYLSRCIRGTETEKQFFVLKSGSGGEFEESIIEKDVPLKARDRIRAAEIMARIYKLMDTLQEKEPRIIIKNTIPRE